ncbi:PREDICTED: short-chain collagen C4-like isoform X2 [Amphimedon queenslandica]|uniref:Chitin-binding type-4 domain-containing protein n=1 Tax=Amphimedon queenslandica TaxID=400682 RepID=A0AAN0JBQ6_AMPQE|nr:PREDICTED: short-chain collagen C4-like isoform X2 [Amphimedon queenslandica]|eukprot:XP_019854450.1 PREDICTED: short-chain collagen C4-like isoform X2 [Amphimedon queenslandica]
MKRIVLVAFFAFLISSSYCTRTGDDTDNEESVNVAENGKFKETNDLDSELATNTEAEATDDKAEQQNIGLKLTDKGIVITLTPDYDSRGSGVVYTRWGKTTCRSGAERVYAGYAGGSGYHEHGGGANIVCMPTSGVGHLSTQNPGHYTFMYGTEYESQNKIWSNHNWNVPCAVCYVPDKSTKMQLPGRINCPDSWTQEYRGYLMADHRGHRRNQVFECIDEAGEKIHGSNSDTNGALLYFVMPKCNQGMPCGPYNANIAITCSICTR